MYDHYRASRQLERMFGIDPDLPRPKLDYTQLEVLETIATVVYHPKTGKIEVIRADPSKQNKE